MKTLPKNSIQSSSETKSKFQILKIRKKKKIKILKIRLLEALRIGTYIMCTKFRKDRIKTVGGVGIWKKVDAAGRRRTPPDAARRTPDSSASDKLRWLSVKRS